MRMLLRPLQGSYDNAGKFARKFMAALPAHKSSPDVRETIAVAKSQNWRIRRQILCHLVFSSLQIYLDIRKTSRVWWICMQSLSNRFCLRIFFKLQSIVSALDGGQHLHTRANGYMCNTSGIELVVRAQQRAVHRPTVNCGRPIICERRNERTLHHF